MHGNGRLDSAYGSADWADLNLGLTLFSSIGQDKEILESCGVRDPYGEAIERLEKAVAQNPSDESGLFRMGQLLVQGSDREVKDKGRELLNVKAGSIVQGNAPVKAPEGDAVEHWASLGCASYECGDLKTATAALDHLLIEGQHFAKDEALCTKAMIMLRRGQLREAEKFYRELGREEKTDTRELYEEKDLSRFKKSAYTWERFHWEPIGRNLEWTRTNGR